MTNTRRLILDPTVAGVAGTYGAAGRTFGEDDWTWGQSAQEPTDVGYRFGPFPGWWPSSPSWTYRVGDTAPDLDITVQNDAGVIIDYDIIVSARIYLTALTYGGAGGTVSYPLTVDTDRLTRTWEAGDLDTAGAFLPRLELVFVSERSMLVSSDDRQTLVVTDA